MKNIVILAFTAFAFGAFAQKHPVSTKPVAAGSATTIKTTADSLSYCIGVNVGKNLKAQGIEEINSEMMAKAIADVYSSGGATAISPDVANQFLGMYFQKMQNKKSEGNIAAGKKFLEENKSKPGVKTTPSGLQYLVMKEGTGDRMPKATDTVTVHYHGTLIDGKVFDSSVDRGQPATFTLNQVIKGWTEGVQLMKVGSKFKFFIPSELAYGEQAMGAIGPHSTLIFEVELLSIGAAK